jgi:hypothetical protein
MLIALAAKVGDALTTQKGEVAFHAAVHRTDAEVAPRLAVLLAVGLWAWAIGRLSGSVMRK